MGNVSTARKNYLATGAFTDARCFRIERKDGTVHRFTMHHADLTMSTKWNPIAQTTGAITPVTYACIGTTASSAVTTSSDLAVDNMEIRGAYDASGIARNDLLSGKFDDCDIYIFDTNYTAPVEDEHPKRHGTKGQVTMRDFDYSIEFRSLVQLLQQNVGRVYTGLDDYTLADSGYPLYPATWAAATYYTAAIANDANVGDIVQPTAPNAGAHENIFAFKCTTTGTSGGSEPTWNYSLGATTTDGSVVWTCVYHPSPANLTVTVGGSKTFSLAGAWTPPWATGYWAGGTVTFLTGENAGFTMEITDYAAGVSTLFLPMPYTIAIGDTVRLTVGYDQTLEMRRDRFSDIMNFFGFPYVPTRDQAYQRGLKSVET